ncbi:MAG: nucleoside triphosphate pyrophosphohydrolase [Rhodospirillales bacterium]|nr:nucleoside triphosphate pyrophosphohydrolase [Rhodospirillales bacterium]
MSSSVTPSNFERLVEIMSRLRDPDTGCPWDVEQTFATIAPYTIEEAYEVADAVERGDMDELRDELGDLLLQVVFHSRMAEEAGMFDVEDVANSISEKMLRRHPHVFTDQRIDNAEAQTIAWEDIKAAERDNKAKRTGAKHPASVLDGVANGLPALTRALKLQKRAARVGFDWADARLVIEKFREELDELDVELNANTLDQSRVQDEVGDLLFTCVNIARQLDIDPESALRHGNIKFERRFRELEENVRADGNKPQSMSLDALEEAWHAAKASLAGKY